MTAKWRLEFGLTRDVSWLVFYGFENTGDVPELDTRVWWHVRVLRYLVES